MELDAIKELLAERDTLKAENARLRKDSLVSALSDTGRNSKENRIKTLESALQELENRLVLGTRKLEESRASPIAMMEVRNLQQERNFLRKELETLNPKADILSSEMSASDRAELAAAERELSECRRECDNARQLTGRIPSEVSLAKLARASGKLERLRKKLFRA